MIKIHYNGKAASLDEQLALLKQHGVLIPDEKTAGKYLSFVGYYRLFAYVKPFLSNMRHITVKKGVVTKKVNLVMDNP